MTELCDAAQLVVAVGAYVRGAMVVLLTLRTFLRRRHFASLRIDSGFLLTAPEPILLIAITYLLHSRAADLSGATTAFALAAAFSGAALVLFGWLLVLWTFASWPSIFVGHAVLRDHHLVTNGAYGFVRHPVYLGAFLIWLGVGVGFASGWALLVAILYVIPAYLLYIRDEEAMLDEAFGDAYRRYRGSVPRLIPQLRRRPVATSGAGTLLLLLLSVVPVYAGEHPGQSLYLRYCAASHGRGAVTVRSPRRWREADGPHAAGSHARRGVPLQAVVDAIDGTRTLRAHGVSEMPVWGEVFRPDSASPQKLVARRAQRVDRSPPLTAPHAHPAVRGQP